MRMGTQEPRWRGHAWRVAAVCLAFPLAACPGLMGLGLPILGMPPEPTEPAGPEASPGQVRGGILVEGTPAPSAPAGSVASPTPAGPTPTSLAGPHAIDVKIRPDRVFLGMRPPEGARPLMEHTAQLSVTVTLSTGLRISRAVWHSSDPTVVEVDSTGYLMAKDKKGEALVTATSEDGLASASVRVTVKDDAGTEVLLE